MKSFYKLLFLSIFTIFIGCQSKELEKTNFFKSSTPSDSVKKTSNLTEIKNSFGGVLPVYETDAEKAITAFAKKLGKADSYADYKNANLGIYGITSPPQSSVLPAAEWEESQALLLSYNSSLPESIKMNFVEIIEGAKDVVDIYVVYESYYDKNDLLSELSNYGVSGSSLHWLNYKNDSIWMRDFGPISISTSSNKVGFIDLRYYPNRVFDDAIPTKVGNSWGINVFRAPINFEGGNFMSDTKGTCYMTQGVFWENPQASQSKIKLYFEKYFGCKKIVVIQPLYGEGTSHIDMLAKLISDDVVILGKYSPSEDYKNYQILNNDETILESAGLNVYRIPMPDNSDGNFRSYTNSLFVNGVNLVPVYDVDKDKEQEALNLYKQLMPNWTHIPIDSSAIITWAGAIHCITMTVKSGSLSKFESDPSLICSTFDCYPDLGSTGNCGDITYYGKCEGTVLYWCEDNQLKQYDCSQDNLVCGLKNTTVGYDCVQQCIPDCSGKECGSDGCGGSCGACAPGETCNEQGKCEKIPDNCGNITYQGCCDGEVLKYCDKGEVKIINCSQDPKCGWDFENNFYNCGTSGKEDPSGIYPKSCNECVPDCTGKECGDDGCGGSCGTCQSASEKCVNGKCVASCIPDCSGKECGDDGCGGSCGTCADNEVCNSSGKCEKQADECNGITWEGCCDGETLKYCDSGKLITYDCSQNPSCGWDSVNGFYNCGTSGAADPQGIFPKSCTTCIPDCTNKECGDDGCGGSCGECGSGEECQNGKCVTICVPDCSGKECGGDGCGGSCGQCEQGEKCSADGKCIPEENKCQGVTEIGCCDDNVLYYCADNSLKSINCGTAGCGWDQQNNFYNCGTNDTYPPQTPPYCPWSCIPDCGGKECGDDGCGGSCGTCPQGKVCESGKCVSDQSCGDVTIQGKCEGSVLIWCENNKLHSIDCAKYGNYKCEWVSDQKGYFCVYKGESCIPDCSGKQCGDDGCGGNCGTCAPDEICNDSGICVSACEPNCDGIECGDDGCGGSCGTCADNEKCENGKCVTVCIPACDDKECGSDGCGGVCGVCDAGYYCSENGKCTKSCIPDCSGKECGSDGCGGTCGECSNGKICQNGKCVETCTPQCENKNCGDDGCGGYCGVCPKDWSCVDGTCVPDSGGCGNITEAGMCDGNVLKWCIANEVKEKDCSEEGKICGFNQAIGAYDCLNAPCEPKCENKECGPDGCGGTCGECDKYENCENGKCIAFCTPQCENKECGPDGCGGFCGFCKEGEACINNKCTIYNPQDTYETKIPEKDVTGTLPDSSQEDDAKTDKIVTEQGESAKSSGGCSFSESTQGGKFNGFLLILLMMSISLFILRTKVE